MPKPGAYRVPLREGAELRSSRISQRLKLALTSIPMTGVEQRPDLIEEVCSCLEAVKDRFEDVVPYYIEGLRSGKIVPVMPLESASYVWAPGELFLRS